MTLATTDPNPTEITTVTVVLPLAVVSHVYDYALIESDAPHQAIAGLRRQRRDYGRQSWFCEGDLDLAAVNWLRDKIQQISWYMTHGPRSTRPQDLTAYQAVLAERAVADAWLRLNDDPDNPTPCAPRASECPLRHTSE